MYSIEEIIQEAEIIDLVTQCYFLYIFYAATYFVFLQRQIQISLVCFKQMDMIR